MQIKKILEKFPELEKHIFFETGLSAESFNLMKNIKFSFMKHKEFYVFNILNFLTMYNHIFVLDKNKKFKHFTIFKYKKYKK